MTFNEYVDSLGQSKAGEIIGVTQGQISHWRTGRYEISLERAIQIEEATDQQLTRYDLRPDKFGRHPNTDG